MEKYGVFFGNWKYEDDEPEFEGTEEECEEYYDNHIDDLDPDEYYNIRKL